MGTSQEEDGPSDWYGGMVPSSLEVEGVCWSPNTPPSTLNFPVISTKVNLEVRGSLQSLQLGVRVRAT